MIKITTKEQFDNLVEQIRTNVIKYEHYISKIKYCLYLTNGDMLNIHYPKNRIPHLLGVDIDYIKSLSIYRDKSAYDVLNSFLKDSYAAYKTVDDPNKLFSSYVDVKNRDFVDKMKINLADIQYIIQYQKDRIYGHEVVESPCEYYIVQEKEKNKLLILGLTSLNGSYVPQTSQELDLTNEKDCTDLQNLLYNQHIAFCSSLRYSGNVDESPKPFYLVNVQKSDKILYLKSISRKYSCVVRVESDYSYVLNRMISMKTNLDSRKEMIQNIANLMSKGELIDSSLLGEDLEDDLKNLIDSYNDSRYCSKESNTTKYSEIIEKYEELKKEVEQLRQENEQLNQTRFDQENEIKLLKQESMENEQTKQKILELLQSNQK